ncbi:GatB/YqeY domain-containing protein [soil metagenome]
MSISMSERLVDDLKRAMKEGDTARRDVIRLLRSAVKNQEIEVGHPLDDQELVDVVQAQIKQRRDSIDAYSKAGRTDLSDKEQQELDILLDYLPAELKPLDEDELNDIVVAKIDELGLNSPADTRILMPALIEATSGRADNRLLTTLASDELRKRAAHNST